MGSHTEARIQRLREYYVKGFTLKELENALEKTDKGMEEEIQALNLAIQDYQKVIAALGHEL